MNGGDGLDRLKIRVLGPLDVSAGGSSIHLTGPIERALIARLALSANRTVSQDRLTDDLWGHDLPAQPRRALHAAVFRLRRALGDVSPALVSADGGYCLRIEPDDLDAAEFERLVGRARRSREEARLQESLTELTAALGLWRGEALEGLRDSPFVLSRARQLEESRSAALLDRFDVELQMGGHARLLPELEAVVYERPADEALCERLIIALYRCNRQADALAAYDHLRKRLLEDVGIDPSPALQHLELAVLRQDPSLSGPLQAAPVAQATSLHSGALALSEGSFDDNLPFALTSFIGRESELSKLGDLMARHRLVTVTGTGGCGKTRLAIEAARALARRSPVRLVRFETLVTPDLVAPTVAQALGIPLRPGETAAETVTDVLSDASLTLVFDNCEHVLDACARLAHVLLESAPRVRLLATSREPLGLPGEMAWRLPSMQLPGAYDDEETILACDAVQLFLDRAGLAVGGVYDVPDGRLGVIADICAQLDGFPLAIELAATRLGTLSLDQLSLRLADRFRLLTGGYRTALPRQQTLQATIDWSYDLLDDREQIVLDRLSVFTGPFGLDAVEAVCTDSSINLEAAQDVIARLVAKSLVAVDRTPETVSYRLLNTIRQYAHAKLARRGELEEIQARHHRWCADLASNAWCRLRGPDPELGIAAVNLYIDDIRAALAWELAGEQPPELVASMWEFWGIRGHSREGREWIGRSLQGDRALEPAQKARLLLGAGVLAKNEDDYGTASSSLSQALELFRRVGDQDGMATCTMQLGSVAMLKGEFDTALSLAAEAIEQFRLLGSDWGVASTELISGNVKLLRGEYAGAEELFRDCLDIGRAIGNSALVGEALVYLGLAAQRNGAVDVATARFEEALPLARLLGDENLINVSIMQLGVGASRKGDDERANELLTEALDMARRRGEPLPIARILLEMAEVAMRRGDWMKAEELAVDSLQRHWSIGSVSAIPQCLELLARTAISGGDVTRSEVLLGAAQSVRERHSLGSSPMLASTRRPDPPPAGGRKARREGARMSTEQAIQVAVRGFEP